MSNIGETNIPRWEDGNWPKPNAPATPLLSNQSESKIMKPLERVAD